MQWVWLWLVWVIPYASGADIWVDGDSGTDSNDGRQATPLATIEAGLARLQPGDTLHILPRTEPWPIGMRVTTNGTKTQPIVIDGHGSLLSGKGKLPKDQWQSHSVGIYSRPLPNNAWGMQHFWEGGFPLVWFDGKAGQNVTSQQELKPGCYFLYKNQKQLKTDPLHNTLFICLPEKVSLDQVESIIGEGGIYVGGNHVTVRNFVVEYGGRDGYATHRNRGVKFENIEARYFMDQGMSHHGAEVRVKNAHFHHNAGGGIVDVYPECRVHYENCLIENDTWRGGVEFYSGEYKMVDCIIRNHPKSSVLISKEAKVTLERCQIEGGDLLTNGIKLNESCQLTLLDCQINGCKTGLHSIINDRTKLKLSGNQFNQCETSFSLLINQRLQAPHPILSKTMEQHNNQWGSGMLLFTRKKQTDKGWQVSTQSFPASEVDLFIRAANRNYLFKSGGSLDIILGGPDFHTARRVTCAHPHRTQRKADTASQIAHANISNR